ncbi:hypothetical protein ACE6H2_010872 [Prunus campanulata]
MRCLLEYVWSKGWTSSEGGVLEACGRIEVPEACGVMEVPEACGRMEVREACGRMEVPEPGDSRGAGKGAGGGAVVARSEES